MRLMTKKIFMLLVALVATTAFAACGGDDDSGSGSGGGTTVTGMNVQPSSLTFTKDGGEQTVSVQAPSQASATSDQSWCTVTTGTMSPNLKVTPVTVKVAAMTTETADRTATITLKAGSESATVTVTQKAGDILTVTPSEYAVAAEGGTFSVKVTTNGDYQVASDAAWLAVGAKGTGEHSFTAAANTSSQRTATLTFTLNKETATVTVTQAAGQAGTITATAMQIARQMNPGWNLGNTMEGGSNANNYTINGGVGAETSWQRTKTTQAVIDYVKSKGFKSVRIPTAWVMGHVSNETDMTIDKAWLDRVQEIVDYCINAGLYVMVNDHWDGGWVENSFGDITDATVQKNCDKMKKLWTQIATRFRDYDEHLLFAGLNEPACDNQNKTNALQKYEQAFIDAVRATGGNNAKRTLVVQGPSTNIDNTDKWFDVSKLNDPAGAGYLGVEVHYYDPFGFTHCHFGGTMGEDKAKKGDWNWPLYFWGSANHVSGADADYNSTWGEEAYLKGQMEKMSKKFASKGYPVFIGEYGANWRQLSSNQAQHDASIKQWFKDVTTQAINNGCVPMAWDINSPNQGGKAGVMTILNRATLSVFCQPAMDGITEGVAAASWPY